MFAHTPIINMNKYNIATILSSSSKLKFILNRSEAGPTYKDMSFREVFLWVLKSSISIIIIYIILLHLIILFNHLHRSSWGKKSTTGFLDLLNQVFFSIKLVLKRTKYWSGALFLAIYVFNYPVRLLKRHFSRIFLSMGF